MGGGRASDLQMRMLSCVFWRTENEPWLQVITRTGAKGEKLEPFEEAVIEVPEEHVGQVVDLMGSRKGTMQDMSASAEGGSRVTYRIPTR
jgi:predicted membrane GTPase involved in stress response